MELQKGVAYFAPGGKQMLIEGTSTKPNKITKVIPVYYHRVLMSHFNLFLLFKQDVLAIILTGMGSDGKIGCEDLKGKGATIWAQDQALLLFMACRKHWQVRDFF